MDIDIDIHTLKQAKSCVPLLPEIAKRWSPRAFADKAVEDDKLLALFEAARWAASSSNQQPWRFIVARQGEETFERMLSCLREGNMGWAKHAPVLIFTFAKVMLDAKDDKPARRNGHAWHDVGQAVASMTIQARALDLFLHQMGGFYPDKARETFALPEAYEPVSFMALGYLGDPEQLEERHQTSEQRARSRQPLEAMVFANSIGKKAAWLEEN